MEVTSQGSNEMTIVGLKPVAPAAKVKTLTARPSTLEGATLAVVWNGLFNSDRFFDALVDELLSFDEYSDVIRISRLGQADSVEWQETKEQATVAITGFGGCGSCTSRSMHDATELDEFGVPALVICHTALLASAEAMARVAGFDLYPTLTVDYPYVPAAKWTHGEARTLARDLAPAIRSMLVAVPQPAMAR
jgi:hypothetical protein